MIALKQYNLGLTEGQLYDFIRSFDVNDDGEVDYEEFEARFALNKFNESTKSKYLIKKISTILAANDISLQENFESFDSNHDGLISFSEFNAMITSLSLDVDQQDITDIFNYISQETNGISIQQFSRAFEPAESRSWQSATISKICTLINQTKTKLLSVFRQFDVDHSGEIDIEEFAAGLSALNIIDEILTDEQIAIIFNSIDADKSGTINFQEFIQAFTVQLVDTSKLDEVLGK